METVGGVHAFVLVCGVHVCGGVGGCVFHESVEVQCAHFLAENILENASSGRRGNSDCPVSQTVSCSPQTVNTHTTNLANQATDVDGNLLSVKTRFI